MGSSHACCFLLCVADRRLSAVPAACQLDLPIEVVLVPFPLRTVPIRTNKENEDTLFAIDMVASLLLWAS